MSWIDCVPNLTVRATQPGNYLRIARNELGDLLEAWQAPDGTGQYRVNFRTVMNIGMTGGQNVVLPISDGERWLLAVQRTAFTYDMLSINRAGELLIALSAYGLRIPLPDGTSQGFAGYWGGELRWLDPHRFLHADGRIDAQAHGRILVCPNVADDGSVIGQHPYRDAVCLWRKHEPLTLRVVFDAMGYEPHIAIDTDGRYRCVARPGREAVLSAAQVDALPVLEAPLTEPPTDPPTVPPPTEPPLMSTPQAIIDTIREAGQIIDIRFPTLRTSDLEAWAAKVAWFLHTRRQVKYGRKRADPGRPVSKNTFAYEVTRGPDTFYAVDIVRDNPPVNEWRPTPIDYGLLTGQVFVEAVPVDLGEDPPTEPPTDPPTDPPTNGDVLARLVSIDTTLTALAARFDRIFRVP